MSADTTSSAGSSAKRQLQKATDDLLKLKDEFESILTDHETQKRELARLTTLLFNDVKELRYKNDALATRVDYLEGIVEELDARGAVDAISSRECPEGEDEVKWARSVALCEGPIIKKLVKKTLDHLLGPDVNSSHPQTMPVYDGNADNIPKDPATDTPYLRFNWSDACTAPSNQVAFKRWVDYSQASGRSIFPQATSILSEVLHCHLAERCAAKYAYVRRRLQEHRVLPQSRGAAQAGTAQGDSDRGAATGSGETATGEAATGGVATGEAAAGETAAGNTTVGANTVAAGTGPSATATANKKLQSLFTSRAKGKLRMRERQFEALAPECPWADPKYKSALTETAMSDDEDQPTLPGAKKKYASRPLTWRSDEFKAFIDFLSNQPEVGSSGSKNMYTTRVRGEPKECAPCRAKDPQLRIRTWMVNPDVLKANQGWLKTGLVVPSGALWGEEEPPVSKAAGKRAAPAKDAAGGSRSKRVRITPVDDSQLDAFKTVRDKLCGGKDEEDLFKVGADENEEEDEFE